ncbi:GIY-YIG nuclease family protein [Herbaspirillum robiniae]|uniref:GIY-YIG nuclease n=1 Tax=Herbaspirillum robiniae TaxID=2014887 RepID=A0A246WKS9_9BURK|nr:GIY-YIG nuclease family protein [Herbaspirillum robiniae]OWY26428.1 GIY-YIG nuclease [Herbaspirillum robiniae]
MSYYVYILANGRNGTLYIGVTNDLIRRVHEHREATIESFSKKYQLTQLVHFETFHDALDAIAREKQLKHWRRSWKLDLIEQYNPYWRDLYPALL